MSGLLSIGSGWDSRSIVAQRFQAAGYQALSGTGGITTAGEQFQAADPAVLSKWLGTSQSVGMRIAAASLFDRMLPLSAESPWRHWGQKMEQTYVRNPMGYAQLLGIEKNCFTVGKAHDADFKSYREMLLTQEGRSDCKGLIARNMQGLRQKITVFRAGAQGQLQEVLGKILPENFSLKSFWKRTIVALQLKDIFGPLKEGRIAGAISGAIGLYMTMKNVFKNTANAYMACCAKEDGSALSRLNTLRKTTMNFLGQCGKGIVGMVIAGMAGAIGSALMPTMLLGTIGGMLFGALASAITSTWLTKNLVSDFIPIEKEREA